jgi:HTH-type transcriptional regulator, sugar sensing transcriptional regulator
MISEDKIENNEILGGLEEMGLSKYESSAYYNLLGKGMISATEIAYSSNLPRTKIYSILKRLENKKLVLINNQKPPLMCRAISPKEAFNDIITKYENKLNGLKKIIFKLQQINDEGLQSKGIEEKKYFVLNQFSTTSKIIDLIRKSKESIDAMINPWGNKLLIYSKDELKKTIIDGVRVRIICDIKCELENKILPNAIEQKFSQINTNVFIFDNCNILILDSIGTKSALIHSNEIFLSTMMNQFNDLWFKLENNFLRSTNKIEYVSNK